MLCRLQELPDPISKASWDNYLTVSPRFAKELGLAKDIIKDVLQSGSGDSFPGTEDILAST